MKKIAILLGFIILLFACSKPSEIEQSKMSSIVLNLSNSTKTLTPDIDMDINEYQISGIGPDNSSFSISTEQQTIQIPNLKFGEWIINVIAKNINGISLGNGSAVVTIKTGESSNVNIVIKPFEGNGSLDLKVLWNMSDIGTPSIEAKLVSINNVNTNLEFQITNGSGTYLNNFIPAGYYTLNLKLMDNGIVVSGAVEIVRILNDQNTKGVFEFFEVNNPGGNININIQHEMNNPIELSLSGHQNEIQAGDQMSITPTVPNNTEAVTYVWYLNGEFYSTENKLLIKQLDGGNYRLDAIVFTVDGKRAGSTSFLFKVTGSLAEVSHLEDLTLLSGLLNPEFSKDQLSYTIDLPYTQETIKIKPTAVFNQATIKVGEETVVSGDFSQDINLNVGENIITIEITSKDGTSTSTYNVVAIRENNEDFTNPTITINYITEGQTVSRNVNITTNVYDDIGINKVEFYIDSVLKSIDTTAPYEYNWNSTLVSNGSCEIKVIAYDTSNNTANAIKNVTIDNIVTYVLKYTTVNATVQTSMVNNTALDNGKYAIAYDDMTNGQGRYSVHATDGSHVSAPTAFIATSPEGIDIDTLEYNNFVISYINDNKKVSCSIFDDGFYKKHCGNFSSEVTDFSTTSYDNGKKIAITTNNGKPDLYNIDAITGNIIDADGYADFYDNIISDISITHTNNQKNLIVFYGSPNDGNLIYYNEFYGMNFSISMYNSGSINSVTTNISSATLTNGDFVVA